MRGRLRGLAGVVRGKLLSIGQRGISMPQCTAAAGAEAIATMGASITAGPHCALAARAILHAEVGIIRLGRNVFVGVGTLITARELIEIGDDVLIAEYVTIRDQDHHFDGIHPTRANGFRVAPVRIGNNVWIGAKATVTRGVTIGDNSVIGANSVVTSDVPANTVAVGAPARPLRKI